MNYGHFLAKFTGFWQDAKIAILCLHLFLNVSKVYTFVYIMSSNVNKLKMWIFKRRWFWPKGTDLSKVSSYMFKKEY